VVLVDRPGATHTVLHLGLPGAPRRAPDFFACLVANAILGGQFASRLETNLRERHGYTYGAGSDFAFRRQGGPFSVEAPVQAAVTAAALKETLGELERLRGETVPAAELARTKELLARSMARAFATPPEVAAALVAQVVEGLPDDYFKTYADHIARVTAAQVRRAATRWIDPRKMAIVLVGDEAQIGGPVKALVGPYETRGDDAQASSPAPAAAGAQQ
jgi:predicted Zn-dependent peptidase